MQDKITNINVDELSLLANPETIKQAAPLTDQAADLVLNSRNDIASIIKGTDTRPLIIVGPCSIHDPHAAIDYAKKLAQLRQDLIDKCFIVMRVYFEKPRTTLGWKGLINDPDMDKSYNIEKGLQTAREILVTILELGLPTASEMLDTIVPQYIADLVCWEMKETKRQPWYMFWRSTFDKKKFQEDMDLVTTFYRNKGFRDFYFVSDSITYSENRKEMNIILSIKEGNEYKYRNFCYGMCSYYWMN